MITLGDPLATHSRAGLRSLALVACCLFASTACSVAGRSGMSPAGVPPSSPGAATSNRAGPPAVAPPTSSRLGAANRSDRGAWSRHSKAGREFLAVGKYREAEEEFIQALSVASAFGPATQRLQTSLFNLGRLNNAYSSSPADLARITRVMIPAAEELHGPSSLVVGNHLSVLGEALVALHEFDEARALLARAMEILRATRGDDSHEVAQLHMQLARLELGSGELELARLEFDRAIEIGERIGGKDDPALAPAVAAQAQILWRLGQTEKAEAALLRSTQLSASAGGLQQASALNSLAWFYSENDRPDDAVPHAVRAVEIIDENPGSASISEFAAFLDTLGVSLMQLEKYKAAEIPLERAYELDTARTTPPFDIVRVHYAQLLRATGRAEQAREIEAGPASPAAMPTPEPEPSPESMAGSGEDVAGDQASTDQASTDQVAAGSAKGQDGGN